MNFCPNCGKPQKPGAPFCVSCGRRFETSAATAQAHRPVSHRESGPARPIPVAFPNAVDPGALNVPNIHDLAAADLPRIAAQLPPRINFIDKFRSKYLVPILVAIGLIAAGAILLIVVGKFKNELEKPIQYELTQTGALFSTNRELYRLDKQGKIEWVGRDANGWLMRGALRFDVGPDGGIYLTNPFGKSIEVFDGSGKWITTIGKRSLSGDFSVFVVSDGSILMADAVADRLVEYMPDGRQLAAMGSQGFGPDNFRAPSGAAELPDGSFLIADSANLRLQHIDSDMNLLATWAIPRKAVIPGDRSDNPVTITHEGQESTLGVRYFPDSIAVDARHRRVYVLFERQAGGDSYVGAFDFDGNFTGTTVLRDPEGVRVNPTNIRMSSDGILTLVDSTDYLIGEWNPASDIVVPTALPAINDLAKKMKRAAKLNDFLSLIGILFFPAGLLVAAVVIGILLWKYRESWLDDEPEARYTRRRAQMFSSESRFHIPGPENVDPSKQHGGVISTVMRLAALPFAAIVYLIIFESQKTNPSAGAAIAGIAVFTILAWGGSFLSLYITKQWTIYGSCEYWNLRKRDQMFRLIGPELGAALIKNESVMDALLAIMPNRRHGLLVLTNYRIIWADAGGRGGLFARKPVLSAQPLRDFKSAEIKDIFSLPVWNIYIKPIMGRGMRVQTPHLWGAKAFIARLDGLLSGTVSAHSTTAAKSTDLCPYCAQTINRGDTACSQCGIKFKKPAVAAPISIIAAGAGQFYNGQFLQGLKYSISFAFSAAAIALGATGILRPGLFWIVLGAVPYSFFLSAGVFQAITDAEYLSTQVEEEQTQQIPE
jgi:hypothetical protein